MNQQEARKLLNNPQQLRSWLRERLVMLAAADNATAIRAIELLNLMPPEQTAVDLSRYSTAQLLDFEERALEWIARALDDRPGSA